MGVTQEEFYDAGKVAIVPMGFCYPGTGASGDLPPRPECAPAWRQPVLDGLKHVQLTLVLGAYAQKWHLGGERRSVTDAVITWRQGWPELLPLPHPSPRNRAWFSRNPWFEDEVVPALRERISAILSRPPT
jgi:uracil-DNA glycosylase